jgi:hypothetical protein
MSLDLQKYLNVYRFQTVLPGSSKKIILTPITTAQMKQLLSSPEDSDTTLDTLITSCVKEPVDFDINDLYLEDRFFLLVELRKKTKGNFYTFTSSCVKCNSDSIQNIDLSKMKVKKMGKLNYIIKLDDNISVQMKYFTRGIQYAAQQLASVHANEVHKVIESAIYKYALCIEKIILPDKEILPAPDEAIEFMNIIPFDFYAKIRDWFDAVDFGLEFKFEYVCDVCKHKEIVEVPLESFLF